MKKQTFTIVGAGLIGGSFALGLKQKGLAKIIIGVDTNPAHLKEALRLRLIDKSASLENAVKESDFIYIATPVDSAVKLAQKILPLLTNQQILSDAGSTKSGICKALSKAPNRGRFVASHPMWGTENSGPKAAVKNAFRNRICVICEKEKSDADALRNAKSVYQALGLNLVYMEPAEHDAHAAYISHISHITSFALANTVLKKEKHDKTIFDLAGGGFESTVRLAKSDPGMWLPIMLENRKNILNVLSEHIAQLKKFKTAINAKNRSALCKLIVSANKIRRVLK